MNKKKHFKHAGKIVDFCSNIDRHCEQEALFSAAECDCNSSEKLPPLWNSNSSKRGGTGNRGKQESCKSGYEKEKSRSKSESESVIGQLTDRIEGVWSNDDSYGGQKYDNRRSD